MKILATIAVFIPKIKINININSAIRHITFLPFFYHCVDKFCLHYSTGTHKTTMLIYRRVGQPSHRALSFNIYAAMYKYQVISINERKESPKPDTKTPKNQQVEKTRGTCTPDQGSGATLGGFRVC